MASNSQDLKSALSFDCIFFQSISLSGFDIHLSEKQNQEMPFYAEL